MCYVGLMRNQEIMSLLASLIQSCKGVFIVSLWFYFETQNLAGDDHLDDKA